MRLLRVLLFLLFAGDTQAQTVVNLFSENDFFLFGKSSDRFYTQGLKVQALVSRDPGRSFACFLPRLRSETRAADGYFIGQNMYTPTDITTTAMLQGDRPYGGWLYIGTSRVSNDDTSKHRLTTSLYLGVIGPMALAGPTQTRFHAIFDFPKPMGWHHEIANDAGINVAFNFEKMLLDNDAPSVLSLLMHQPCLYEFMATSELQAGTVFNNAAVGLLTRFSFFDTKPYFSTVNGLVDNAVPKSILKLLNNIDTVRSALNLPPVNRRRTRFNLALFVHPRLRVVGTNALLEGGLFNGNDSPVHYEAHDLRRFVFEYAYGATVDFDRFIASVQIAHRGKELKAQVFAHDWVQIQIAAVLGKLDRG